MLIGKQDMLVLMIALAGCHGAGANKWGKQSSSISIPDVRLEGYYHCLVDGGIVLDKRPAFAQDDAAGVRGVISGPMLNAQLPDNTIDRFLEGELTLTTDQVSDLGSFDFVSTNLYAAFWENLGARVGQRQGNTVVWRDGTIEQITMPAWAC